MKNKPRVLCKCGKNITANTWKSHLRSLKCQLTSEQKKEVMMILDLRTENHHYGWLIKNGDEAKANPGWFISVINKETSLDDWCFNPPRQHGHCTPSFYKKQSIDRRGAGNPAIKSKTFDFVLEDVEKFILLEWPKYLKNSDLTSTQFIKQINEKFKNWSFLYAKIHNRSSSKLDMLCNALKIDKAEWSKIAFQKRGRFISDGQKNSPVFMEMARRMGSRLFSRRRVSKPQLVLLEMIKSIDLNAELEEVIKHEERWYSFDIISPLINSLVEMHGRVFHDSKASKPDKSIHHIALFNEKNDKIKENIAKLNNYKLFVFWDDEQYKWFEEITRIYDTKPRISLEEAQNKIGYKPRYALRVRHGNADVS